MLALLLAAAAAAPQTGKPVVALMPLRALGVPADVVHALEVTLHNELLQLPEAKLAGDKDLAAALKAEADCEARVQCVAAAAAKAGARDFIWGTTSQLGDTFMVDLKLIDAHSGQEVRRATYPVSGTQDVLIETLHEAAVRLLAPARFVGSIRVDVPGAAGAALFIDGKPAGTLPLAQPIEGLSPGQHTLRVDDSRAGKAREMSTFVEVRFGQTTDAKIELANMPVAVPAAALPAVAAAAPRKPLWLRPAAVASLGLGAAFAVAGIAFHASAYATASDINHRAAANQLQPSDLASYNDVDRDTHIARGLYVAAAIFGLAGGGALLWDLHTDGTSVTGRF